MKKQILKAVILENDLQICCSQQIKSLVFINIYDHLNSYAFVRFLLFEKIFNKEHLPFD